jgi:hypothetical protein
VILFAATNANADANGDKYLARRLAEDANCYFHARHHIPHKRNITTKQECKYQAPIKKQEVVKVTDEEYQPGPYLGGQVGWGRIDEGDGYQQFTSPGIVDLGTFTAWRGVAGYSFVPFFSIEAGYSYYPHNTYTGTNPPNNTIDIRSYSIDLVGKLILPLGKIAEPLHRLSIYVKGGGSYVNTKIDETINNAETTISNDAIRPTYGAGIAFNFTDNISVDASWTGIAGKKRVVYKDGGGNPTPNCNMFALGIYYKITGLY